MTENKLPVHVAFIMDGNGRWAKKRGLSRSLGHNAGARALKRVVTACRELGIKYITVFAFSTENWSRSPDEVNYLMSLFAEFCKKETKPMLEHNLSVRFIGRREGLPDAVKKAFDKAETLTEACTGTILNVAVNYGAREELLQAVNKAIEGGKTLDAKGFESLLYTAGQPMPDIIVRSAGEQRLSNFLLYQAAYAELVFTKEYWPDFNKKTVEKILAEYARRDRRFGGVKGE
jgi:undecaprenyl diphosphate synthase